MMDKVKRERSKKQKAVRDALLVLLIIILAIASYIAYVFITYYRLDDNIELDVTNPENIASEVAVGTEQKIVSWNIGCGMYLQDYSFFMDGGEESRARSKEAVYNSINAMTERMKEENANFYLLQEVEVDSTKTYGVDETKLVYDALQNYSHTYAQNYDSPYLMYPLNEPIGASKAGIVTLSEYNLTSALRRRLDIQTDFAKLIDLDRCYSVSRIPASNGKELVLINLHLSAYTTDETIVDKQLEKLYKDIFKEYQAGNYVICGGDFNIDLLKISGELFGVSGGNDVSWCKPFKEENLPDGFSLIAPYNDDDRYASSRNANEAYNIKTSFRSTIDGFIISDNVMLNESNVIETDYMWSDHNPVFMNFTLEG